KPKRRGGSTARTRSTPGVSGFRTSLGPCTFQRAPAARPRRSGSTPEMPGHQSDRWYGSATNDQTSSTGASRTRSAVYRGTALLDRCALWGDDVPDGGKGLAESVARLLVPWSGALAAVEVIERMTV